MTRSVEELEAENAELRRRIEAQDQTIGRLSEMATGWMRLALGGAKALPATIPVVPASPPWPGFPSPYVVDPVLPPVLPPSVVIVDYGANGPLPHVGTTCQNGCQGPHLSLASALHASASAAVGGVH